MTDPVLLSRALRGVPLTCKYRLHRFRLITRRKVGVVYTTTSRCARCGTVRIEEGTIR